MASAGQAPSAPAGRTQLAPPSPHPVIRECYCTIVARQPPPAPPPVPRQIVKRQRMSTVSPPTETLNTTMRRRNLRVRRLPCCALTSWPAGGDTRRQHSLVGLPITALLHPSRPLRAGTARAGSTTIQGPSSVPGGARTSPNAQLLKSARWLEPFSKPSKLFRRAMQRYRIQPTPLLDLT